MTTPRDYPSRQEHRIPPSVETTGHGRFGNGDFLGPIGDFDGTGCIGKCSQGYGSDEGSAPASLSVNGEQAHATSDELGSRENGRSANNTDDWSNSEASYSGPVGADRLRGRAFTNCHETPSHRFSNVARRRSPSPVRRENHRVDDLDLILSHEDFPKLLGLFFEAKQKEEGEAMNAPVHRHTTYHIPVSSKSADVLKTVERMQRQLLSAPRRRVSRGKYVVTDLIMDDCIKAFQKTLRIDGPVSVIEPLSSSLRNTPENDKKPAAGGSITDEPDVRAPVPDKRNGVNYVKKGSKKKGPTVGNNKYEKWQTQMLMQWMIDHKDHPFPSHSDVSELMEKTNLTHSQIINWSTNIRKRNRKAICNLSKEPHHFLDYLFLAHDRETRSTNKHLIRQPEPLSPNATKEASSTASPPCLKRAQSIRTPSSSPGKSRPSLRDAAGPMSGAPTAQTASSQDDLVPPSLTLEEAGDPQLLASYQRRSVDSNAHHKDQNLDPLPMVTMQGGLVGDPHEEMLMEEFVSFWFDNGDATALGGKWDADFHPAEDKEGEGLSYSAGQRTNRDVASVEKRERSPSPELDDLLDGTIDENITDWAEEMGLSCLLDHV